MKKKLTVLLAMALALSIVSAPPAVARGHRALVGPMELEFNLGFGDPAAPYPEITWVGTVEFKGELYGIAFFPTWGKDVKNLHLFREIWKVYPYDESDPFFEFEEGLLTEFSPEAPLMVGHDAGISNLKTNRYWAVGRVDEAAGPFVGRHRMFMRGVIEWYDFGAPHYAPGILRIR